MATEPTRLSDSLWNSLVILGHHDDHGYSNSCDGTDYEPDIRSRTMDDRHGWCTQMRSGEPMRWGYGTIRPEIESLGTSAAWTETTHNCLDKSALIP